MGIVIDLIVIGVIALCIFLGYRKGLTGSLLKIISFVLALVIAFVLFKPVSNFIIDNTNWDENLEQGIRDMILADKNEEEQVEESKEETENEAEQNKNMPNVMMDYINKQVEQAGDNAKEAIVDATAKDVSVTIINAAVWIILFLITRIILIFVKGLANLITKLPVIKQFDKIGGVIYGILEGIVVVYLLLAILSFASPLVSGTGIIGGVQQSYIASMMYNNNLLLTLIF